MNIKEIQSYLVKQELDGWLLADFHARNDVAVRFLELPQHLTRRSFYYIPAEGKPIGLMAHIEKNKFAHLPGELVPVAGYTELEGKLAGMLSNSKRIAMEYAPKGRLPYVGLVEAGTIELIRSFGLEIISSADLVAKFLAALSDEQIAAHHEAAKNVVKIADSAFNLISSALKENRTITEFDVCQYILEQFESHQMDTEFTPNCSADANAGDPHYEPTAERSSVIELGQIVLIDLWAKLRTKPGIFADITQMAFTGTEDEIPEQYSSQFTVLCKARDAAVEFIREAIPKGKLRGCDVDDACRKVIADASLGDAFTHRTGHSIHSSVHGPGPNIDNLETEDCRLLQTGHLFSIEPGVYFPEYGLRTEIDALITPNGVEVTTLPLQNKIRPLL